MAFSIPKKVVQLLTVLAAAVVLLLSASTGITAGKNRAQASAVLANVASLTKGLQYFLGDNGRYPTAAEFQSNRDLMLNYFSVFPPTQLPLGKCPSSYSYQRPSSQTFKLQFCLAASWNGYNSGWNQFTENK